MEARPLSRARTRIIRIPCAADSAGEDDSVGIKKGPALLRGQFQGGYHQRPYLIFDSMNRHSFDTHVRSGK